MKKQQREKLNQERLAELSGFRKQCLHTSLTFKGVGVLLVRAISARQASHAITHTVTSKMNEKMGWFFALIGVSATYVQSDV